MNTYIYEGPVMLFDKLIESKWRGETRASSEKKAKSNLSYQYKKKFGYAPTSRITLSGSVRMA